MNYTHYEKMVFHKQLTDKSFKSTLKENGIEYTELPVMENDVLTYAEDGETKYALIAKENATDTYVENVYITNEIPTDMSWSNLLLDCQGQKNGEKPMELKTKAKLICEKAYQIAIEPNMNMFQIAELKAEDFRIALTKLGYTLSEIKEMDHHDVDEKFLEEMEK